METLSREQRTLVHQVHPAKLAVDIVSSLLSDVLLWRHELRAGVLVRYVSPVVGSGFVLRFADVDWLAQTVAGRYVGSHMPPGMVAIRLAGDTVMAFGAWQRRPDYLGVGALLIVLGWSHGLLVRPRSRR